MLPFIACGSGDNRSHGPTVAGHCSTPKLLNKESTVISADIVAYKYHYFSAWGAVNDFLKGKFLDLRASGPYSLGWVTMHTTIK